MTVSTIQNICKYQHQLQVAVGIKQWSNERWLAIVGRSVITYEGYKHGVLSGHYTERQITIIITARISDYIQVGLSSGL